MIKKLFILMCIVGLVASCGTGITRNADHPAIADMCPESEAVELPKIEATVYFDFDKTNLKPEGIKKLEAVVAQMKEFDDLNVIINGHTDKYGSDDYNMTLSQKRAQVVKDFLMDKGIDETRIGTKGFGKMKMVSKVNWENRRAVVLSVD
jgi:outer membrane protein OmpA-like peptidoglycan-associated protein